MAIRHCFRKIQRKEMHQTMTKVDIFSGFLGAGKTTLIKKLIPEAFHGEKLVLIENEFGEIGIDGGFLEEAGLCSRMRATVAVSLSSDIPAVRERTMVEAVSTWLL